VRVPAEDRKQVAQVIDGTEYRARRGFFEMPDHHARAHLRSGGFGASWPVAGVPATGAGYRCAACGFGSWFRICGRCGAECTK
jgi:hypothetical protein